MSLNTVEEVEYALAKQVPDMKTGFVIKTHYGSIDFNDIIEYRGHDELNKIVNCIERVLEHRLRILKLDICSINTAK
ncbi:hypothetical protein H0A36_27385 [Endozoicomonas sp. SM1973]|uniref:Uncharacterized protein n=1 Tax=Spartinivicinus marinus TaxID=2994442 RepID=A0A853IA04_9GAMM|nr:hypothetical protein [Spartinivicinus marinus]MCX4025084.1 hypothetical protein [Spartinivicinus marinus]NYZ69739.1 hypothetical protein [Spartinivicinus marinus]